MPEIPRAFEDLRQQTKDARRIALLAGRLAARQSDFRRLDVQFVGSGPQALASVAFPGEKQAVAVARTTAQQK